MNKERGLRAKTGVLDDPFFLPDRSNMLVDIYILLGYWFMSLEDEGGDPWGIAECVAFAERYGYTKEDYNKYLSTII